MKLYRYQGAIEAWQYTLVWSSNYNKRWDKSSDIKFIRLMYVRKRLQRYIVSLGIRTKERTKTNKKRGIIKRAAWTTFRTSLLNIIEPIKGSFCELLQGAWQQFRDRILRIEAYIIILTTDLLACWVFYLYVEPLVNCTWPCYVYNRVL